MDVGDPTRVITPTLDGPVLSVLAAAGRPMTVREVALRTVRGSEIGVRKCLVRLVAQGIVTFTETGRVRAYELNRDHIGAAIAEQLGGLRLKLWDRFRAHVAKWKVKPLYGCVFGSAARGDGDELSDIDVLLVHPPFIGEKAPNRMRSVKDFIGTAVMEAGLPLIEAGDQGRWERQVDGLREAAFRWTGNRLQVVDVSAYQWVDVRQVDAALIENIERDHIDIVAPRTSLSMATRLGGAS